MEVKQITKKVRFFTHEAATPEKAVSGLVESLNGRGWSVVRQGGAMPEAMFMVDKPHWWASTGAIYLGRKRVLDRPFIDIEKPWEFKLQ